MHVSADHSQEVTDDTWMCQRVWYLASSLLLSCEMSVFLYIITSYHHPV